MRVALVHYWLVNDRGGEKVLKAFYDLFPDATIFTHVVDPKKMPADLADARIETSFVSKVPFAKSKYQLYLPFMPAALEALDLSGYDLVISSESGPAKGVLPAPNATHICYVHSPMRYIWNMYAESMRRANPVVRALFPWISNYLRLYDVTSAARVDQFVANSHNVAARVRRYWRRDADVLHPPVAVEDFTFSPKHEGFYLYVGELVDYKRADVIVDAFTKLGAPLVVIGSGPDEKRIRRSAGANITFLGRTDFATLRDHYERCRAFVFAAEEDFGIVPVEAMACGKPVIAFGKGGALETVIEGATGMFFHEQTPAAVVEAVRAFEANASGFDPHAIRAHAETFATPLFKAKFLRLVEQAMDPARSARRLVV
jgi:glycosyltransferase involved in cell wall biosynthesis